jgi:cysteine synthase
MGAMMGSSGGASAVEAGAYERTVQHFREGGIALPTFAQLANPELIPDTVLRRLASVDPDAPDPLNLFRVHWFNATDRRARVGVPDHLVLPPELTGVPARIVVALGNRFPMIGSHKVLAAYACLVPRIVSGRFDPTRNRAVWPSTGNYCRGGVAISRLMGCRGTAVLPEGMSRERFAWLERWVTDPDDIVRTQGTESNVKEIYDKCAELATDPENVVLNQFSEFANHLAHYLWTGRAMERVYESMAEGEPSLRLRAFVSASGSAGTIGAGDYLKETTGALIVALEALECPTMLRNGFGEHNIQGIGDKHIPLIHNVMNTDMVAAVSDQATDTLNVVFNSEVGHALLRRRGIADDILEGLSSLGLSSICNILGAIKVAKFFDMSADDVILTVATDGAAMYESEAEDTLAKHFDGRLVEGAAAETFGRFVLGAGTDDMLDLTYPERQRIFNLGYFTWVEQQGVSVEDFQHRRHQSFWRGLRGEIPVWDGLITEMNGRTGVLDSF